MVLRSKVTPADLNRVPKVSSREMLEIWRRIRFPVKEGTPRNYRFPKSDSPIGPITEDGCRPG